MPIQLCCLCVETFAFWLVIYMKHSIHLTITHRIHFSVIYDVHVSASTKLMTRYPPSRGRTTPATTSSAAKAATRLQGTDER